MAACLLSLSTFSLGISVIVYWNLFGICNLGFVIFLLWPLLNFGFNNFDETLEYRLF